MAEHDKTIVKTDLMNRNGMNTLAEIIFRLIENNYLRKKKYEDDIKELQDRIEYIEEINNILDNYSFEIDYDTGELTLTVPDSDYTAISKELVIESDGNLYLNTPLDTLTVAETAIAHYSFEIVNKDLILTL